MVALGFCSPREIVGLVDLLEGVTKLENLELTMGCAMLVDSLIEHLERDSGFLPWLRLIEASQLSREIREKPEVRCKRLNH